MEVLVAVARKMVARCPSVASVEELEADGVGRRGRGGEGIAGRERGGSGRVLMSERKGNKVIHRDEAIRRKQVLAR